MRCVLVSSSLDLRCYLGAKFMRAADRIEIVNHPHQDLRPTSSWRWPGIRRTTHSIAIPT